MAALWRIVARVLVVVVIALVLFGGSAEVEGRRRAGRSFRSSLRRVRISRGSSVRRFVPSWKSSTAGAAIFGLAMYKRRRRYISHPNRDPTVCTNHYNYGTYKHFICPQYNQSEELDQCCGRYNNQHCCKRAETNVGMIVGIVLGVLVFLGLVIGGIVCCCCIVKAQRKKEPGEKYETDVGYTPTAPPNVYASAPKASEMTAAEGAPVDSPPPYQP